MHPWVRRFFSLVPRREWLPEVALIVLLAVATLAYRIIHLEPIEIGGDALAVWEFARHLAYGGKLPEHFNHHTARFGLVLPVLLSQWLLGSQAPVYFAAPLAMSVVLHLCVYGIGRQLSGPLAGTCAVLFLLAAPQMLRACSQILPELFGPTYVALAIFAALGYTNAVGRRSQLLWLGATGLALFFAYGAKIPYLYFAPGCGLLVWKGAEPRLVSCVASGSRVAKFRNLFERRGLLDPLLLTAIVVGLILLESTFYLLFTKYSSQLAVVNKTHGVSYGAVIRKPSDLFAAYRTTENAWVVTYCVGVCASLACLVWGRNKRIALFVATLIVYVLMHALILRKLNPPIPWTRPHLRYLLAIVPPLAVMSGVFVGEAMVGLVVRYRLTAGASVGTVARHALPLLLVFGLCWTLWSERASTRSSGNGLVRARRDSQVFSKAFAAGQPIATRSHGGKPVRAALSLFIDPELLVRDGHLVAWERFRGRPTGFQYAARAVYGAGHQTLEVLDAEVAKRLRKNRCVVNLTQRGRYFAGASPVDTSCAPVAASNDGSRH